MKKNDLEVIKEGKTGHGILIENDGFVTLDRKKLNESMEDGEWHVPNPFVVDAVFQKFGIKNANGRIYPEGILKREVEKYQQKINERRAYGEANHPSDSTINLSRVSHNIIELHWENATLALIEAITAGFTIGITGQSRLHLHMPKSLSAKKDLGTFYYASRNSR